MRILSAVLGLLWCLLGVRPDEYLPQRHLANRPVQMRRMEAQGEPFCKWGGEVISQHAAKGQWNTASQVPPMLSRQP